MADLLQAGSDFLNASHRAFASGTVYYRRAGLGMALVSATVGSTLLRVDDDVGGVRTQWIDRDYLILASDLVLGGTPIEPQSGDEIIETGGGIRRTYEVGAPFGENAWRWSDPYYTMMRVKTKLIREEGLQ